MGYQGPIALAFGRSIMSEIPPPPNAKALLAKAGIRPKKDWGQNFLKEQDILRFISESCRPRENERVVELGAGLGALTYYLAQDYSHVTAVERDRELFPIVKDYFQWAENLDWMEADAAKFDYEALSSETGQELVVIGNLPYQISSRILVSLADATNWVRRSVVLIQKEVAERIVAGPGSRTYGLLSVLIQRCFDAHILRIVPPHVFLPPPKVHSAIIALERKETRFSKAEDAQLIAAARAAFSSRRKTLRNSVAGGLGMKPAQVESAITDSGIDFRRRAESLELAEFASLGRALAEAGLLRLDESVDS